MGATVIATSSSDAKLQIAKKLGASELINYTTTPAWGDETLRLTDGKGADLVADVGGSGTVEQSLKALRQGGLACMIGFLAPPKQADIIYHLVGAAKKRRFPPRGRADSYQPNVTPEPC
jgi:NADPH:quinone reductase-like Zn-dependent oxidoreductase